MNARSIAFLIFELELVGALYLTSGPQAAGTALGIFAVWSLWAMVFQ